jgi:hypothetical protein
MVDIIARSQEQLIQFHPNEMCAVLWAVSGHPALDDSSRMKLFHHMTDMIDQGMSLELFTSHDLSVLAWATGSVQHYHQGSMWP